MIRAQRWHGILSLGNFAVRNDLTTGGTRLETLWAERSPWTTLPWTLPWVRRQQQRVKDPPFRISSIPSDEVLGFRLDLVGFAQDSRALDCGCHWHSREARLCQLGRCRSEGQWRTNCPPLGTEIAQCDSDAGWHRRWLAGPKCDECLGPIQR